MKNLDLIGNVTVEKPLDIQCNITEDHFSFNIKMNRRKLAKRVILSIISSIYGPLGCTSPFVLEEKQLSLCHQDVQWDENVDEELEKLWIKWEMKLKHIESLQILRRLKQPAFGRITEISIHHFSDASEHGYGHYSCINFVNNDGMIHCSLLMGKLRTLLKKFLPIPRLELTAAVLYVKVACLLRKEL